MTSRQIAPHSGGFLSYFERGKCAALYHPQSSFACPRMIPCRTRCLGISTCCRAASLYCNPPPHFLVLPPRFCTLCCVVSRPVLLSPPSPPYHSTAVKTFFLHPQMSKRPLVYARLRRVWRVRRQGPALGPLRTRQRKKVRLREHGKKARFQRLREHGRRRSC